MSSPLVVVFFGMTASGKSTLAMSWSAQCGAPYYNTDRVRKELLGLKVTDRRPDGIDQGIYTHAFTEQTYATMLQWASRDIAQGAALVILDGSYGKRADRDAVRQMAEAVGARCLFMHCVCSEGETRRRLAHRATDSGAVSDGRWEIYTHQLSNFEGPGTDEQQDCVYLDTERTSAELLKEVMAQAGCRC
jgi:predicted kinase